MATPYHHTKKSLLNWAKNHSFQFNFYELQITCNERTKASSKTVRGKKKCFAILITRFFLQVVKTGSFQTQIVDQVGKCDTFLNVTPCLAKNEPTGKASEFKKLISHFKHRYFYKNQ